ncbi:MAG: DUF3276 family protein [Spirochaetales bacterium]|nr:DUF3276 family protein [Spirochaetales bacterium]
MGHRGEIFTRKIYVKDGEKTYFFNIKENRYGDRFLNMVESSKKKEGGDFVRNSIMIYQEDLIPFMDGFSLSRTHLDKRDKTMLSLSKAKEGGRRTFHFSVKWNKFGWGSIFISEERADHVSERRNETILIDERDLEDFLKGYEPAMSRLREEKKEVPAPSRPKPVKVRISKPSRSTTAKPVKAAKKERVKITVKK